MSALVPADQIEEIVGARRHATEHVGRAVSVERRMYILHSHECRDSGIDLRDCAYSKALDLGLNEDRWSYHADRAVRLCIAGDGDLAAVVQIQSVRPDSGETG